VKYTTQLDKALDDDNQVNAMYIIWYFLFLSSCRGPIGVAFSLKRAFYWTNIWTRPWGHDESSQALVSFWENYKKCVLILLIMSTFRRSTTKENTTNYTV